MRLLLTILPIAALAAALNPNHQEILRGGHPSEPSPPPPPKSIQHVVKALTKSSIIPTVLPPFTPHLLLSVVWNHHDNDNNNNNQKHKKHHKKHPSAHLGNTLPPSSLQHKPSLALHLPHHHHHKAKSLLTTNPSFKHTTYIIALTDPDVPPDAVFANDDKTIQFCHWIAYIRPTSSEASPKHKTLRFEDGDGSEGKMTELIEYKPPSPPKGTGKHRYVFIMFVPRNGTSEELDLSKPSGRKGWGYDDGDDNEGGDEGSGVTKKGVREWAEENGLVPVAANFIYSKYEK